LIRCGHPERHAGQIQRREASDDKQIREIQKLENGVAPMTAAKAEGIPSYQAADRLAEKRLQSVQKKWKPAR